VDTFSVEKASANGGREGTERSDADPHAAWLGTGKSGVSTALHLAVNTGRYEGEAGWFNELQRISASPEDAVRNLIAQGDVDVTALLPKVSAPTLVMHARDEARVPFEAGRRFAAEIPAARFVPLQSRNHLILETEPAFIRFLQEIRTFLVS
jgi:pimeloyl-ACP methyl ester carboxylesterase